MTCFVRRASLRSVEPEEQQHVRGAGEAVQRALGSNRSDRLLPHRRRRSEPRVLEPVLQRDGPEKLVV